VADLSRFRDGQIALRWRVESEVLEGKGQFTCGELNCRERHGLASYEVNFG
jgi:protein FRA10AC1